LDLYTAVSPGSVGRFAAGGVYRKEVQTCDNRGGSITKESEGMILRKEAELSRNQHAMLRVR